MQEWTQLGTAIHQEVQSELENSVQLVTEQREHSAQRSGITRSGGWEHSLAQLILQILQENFRCTV